MHTKFIIIILFLFACQQSTQTSSLEEVSEENLSQAVAESTPPKQVPYGNNPDAGDYFEVDGVKLYYEVYGSGSPILMLHGGVYGYIDELGPFIPKLAEEHQVICLATRGHGKSEIGNEPFTFAQRANDAYQLLQHLGIEKTIVFGFSDGGYSALKLAALHPNSVAKVIAMGVGDRPKGSREPSNYTSESLMAQSGGFFESRKQLMPEPDRWDECLQYLNHLYNEDEISEETLAKIKCPVLLMNGENDEYASIDEFVQAHKYIPKSNLSIIPGCGHVIFFCNFEAVWASMVNFIK